MSLLDVYQGHAIASDQHPEEGFAGVGFALLGLIGETGGLLSAVKKKRRDPFPAYKEELLEENGDVLWYLSNVCSRVGVTLSELARFSGLLTPTDQASFGSIQINVDEKDSNDLDAALYHIAACAGAISLEYAHQRSHPTSEFIKKLGEFFHALVRIAVLEGISLEVAAARNIAKVQDRWPDNPRWGDLFDSEYDSSEQLPRRIEMLFVEQTIGDRTSVLLQCNGINIGDRLTDNRLPPDDYRFHDVFHLAYAAVLGWSPVIRSLFRVKRKSNPATDENEDGARAILIEEGVSAWIFNKASAYDFFANTSSIDYAMLKAVRSMVDGHEVAIRPLWQWEKAILSGFMIFRELRMYRRGIVVVDLNTHSLEFRR